MVEKMRVTVIIPTYNGAHKIMGVLNSLEKQTELPDEVVVVIDGSTDETEKLLSSESFQFSSFKVIVQPNSGRAKVRNRGAKDASGDLLLFLDDDMLPEPNCIERHIKHHLLNPLSILTGGLEDKAENESHDFLKYKSFISRKWAKPLIAFQNAPLSNNTIFLTAANFSIGKELFFSLEGFDERLKDAEDFDLAVRAKQQNINSFYDHAAFAWHNDTITGRSYIKRLRQYRKSHERLRELNPVLYTSIPMHNPAMPSGVKRIVFLFFSRKYWVDWLDSNSWYKKILPTFLRYKLYDLITTANGTYFPQKVNL